MGLYIAHSNLMHLICFMFLCDINLLLFYAFGRDGVGESQFSQVLNYELDQIIKVLYTVVYVML